MNEEKRVENEAYTELGVVLDYNDKMCSVYTV